MTEAQSKRLKVDDGDPSRIKWDPLPGDPRRYFKIAYDPRADAALLIHGNGIAVCCLAKEHPVLARGLEVTHVDFTATSGANLLDAVSSVRIPTLVNPAPLNFWP